MGEYSQATGSSLDFDLVGIDQYTQLTGSTVDFELIEAETLSLTESVAVNGSYNRTATFSRSNLESLVLNDADVREIGKAVQEMVALNDFSAKQMDRTVSEGFTADDVYSREADYFRNYSDSLGINSFTQLFAVVRLDEQVALNDADVRQLEKLFSEGLGADSVYSREADYFRTVSDGFSLNDFFDSAKLRFLTVSEGMGLNDTTELLTVLRLDEAVTLNEVYNRRADFFRNYNDSVGFDEDFSFFAQLVKDETLALDTFAPITTVVRLDEAVSLNDVSTQTMRKALNEAVSLDDSIRKRDIFAVRSERLGVNDADVRELERSLQEGLGSSDVYSRTGSFFRDYSDGVVVDDTDTKLVLKILETEMLGLNEESSFTVGKVLNEQFSAAEVFISDADYFRTVEEGFEIAEFKDFEQDLFRTFEETTAFEANSAKRLQRSLQEALSFDDVFNQFFSEGPGVSPYYVRNSFVQKNKLNNEYVTKTIQNMFESLEMNNSFGDQEQT